MDGAVRAGLRPSGHAPRLLTRHAPALGFRRMQRPEGGGEFGTVGGVQVGGVDVVAEGEGYHFESR